jgi:CRP/FNR family transcriptional regulator
VSSVEATTAAPVLPAELRSLGPATHSCDDCAVRDYALCSALEPLELRALSALGRRRSLRAGESLIWEGDDSMLVGNVIEGVLKLSTSTSDGREQIVGVVYPADFIGRPFGGTSSHTVTALTDARVCVFSRGDFDRFADRHSALERKLLRRTLAELERTRHWMVLLGCKSAPEKIATFLLETSERPNAPAGRTPGQGDRFELAFSRQQIAELLGLTIETVSRHFTKLKRDGIIDLPGRRGVVILDRAALTRLAG